MRPCFLSVCLLILFPFSVRSPADAGTPSGAADSSVRLKAALRLLRAAPETPEYPGMESERRKRRVLTAREKAIAEEVIAFRRETRRFADGAPSLTPEVAAQQWIALLNRTEAILAQQSDFPFIAYDELVEEKYANLRRITFADMVDCLPPPPSWREIRNAILRRPLPSGTTEADAVKLLRERTLRLFAQRLVGDEDGQWAEWSAMRRENIALAEQSLKARKKSNGRQIKVAEPLEPQPAAAQWSWGLREIGDTLISQTRDPQKAVAGIELQIAASNKEDKLLFPSYSEPDARMRDRRITVTDTPGLTELPEGKVLIKRLLLSSEVELMATHGGTVEREARRIARENLPLLPDKYSVWALAYGISDDAMTFYEGLMRRFAGVKPSDETRTARAWYLGGLVVQGRIAEAADRTARERLVESFADNSVSDAVQESGHRREWYEFLRETLRRWPDAPVRREMATLGVTLGRGEEVLSLARAGAARKNLSPRQRERALRIWADAAFAQDKVSEGIAALREAVRLTQRAAHQNPQQSDDYAPLDILFADAVRFVRLGNVLDRPDWRDEGIGIAVGVVRADLAGDYMSRYVSLLDEAGKSAEAEALLTDTIYAAARKFSKRYPIQGVIRVYLTQLIGVYDAQGRWADILTLLQETPVWESGDLRDMLTDQTGKTTVGMAAAHALAAKGHIKTAIAITRASLDAAPKDRDYDFYLQLVGSEASLPYLDELAGQNRFEERPLIWQAVALFRLKRYNEAEKAARAAIQIDPSDGDAPHGDRMRAYAVLSEIRKAQGDTKEAQFLAGVIKAIRAAERADDIAEAGLTTRAIALYENALTYFADAYCIQSRLAVKLAGMGRYAEAETHFRKAYELMPDSFGRRESHCFGCEGAFSSPEGAKIAEQVLTRMAAERPTKPQVFYLLGYIQDGQERYAEALPNFKRAVALDPDYINAWLSLAGLQTKMKLSDADNEAIRSNIARLNPRSGRALPRPGRIGSESNLPERYQQAKEFNRAASPAAAPPLFALPASASALKRRPPASEYGDAYDRFSYYFLGGQTDLRQIISLLAPELRLRG